MKAVDAKVLARFFVDDPDDPQAAQQRPAAIAALSGRTFVPVTVILEFEWVLRGFYALPAAQVARVLTALVGIEHVTVEDREAVRFAIDACQRGLDFADALHIARSARASGFATFDRRIAKRSAALGLPTPVQLLT